MVSSESEDLMQMRVTLSGGKHHVAASPLGIQSIGHRDRF